jgi:hypothetical protein
LKGQYKYLSHNFTCGTREQLGSSLDRWCANTGFVTLQRVVLLLLSMATAKELARHSGWNIDSGSNFEHKVQSIATEQPVFFEIFCSCLHRFVLEKIGLDGIWHAGTAQRHGKNPIVRIVVD